MTILNTKKQVKLDKILQFYQKVNFFYQFNLSDLLKLSEKESAI